MSTFTALADLPKVKLDIDDVVSSKFKKELIPVPVIFLRAKNPEAQFVAHKSPYIPINPKSSLVSLQSSSSHQLFTDHSNDTSSSDFQEIAEPILDPTRKLSNKWKNQLGSGQGLLNFGNTCYMNSALQCIAYSSPLTNYLLQCSTKLMNECPAKNASKFCALCSFCAILQRIFNTKRSGAVKPIEIINNLKNVCKTFRPMRQEDSHEFLRELLSKMDEIATKHHSISKAFNQYHQIPRAKLLPGEEPPPKPKPTSLIFAIYGGYLRSRVHCTKCNYNSDTFDPYMDLSVEIKGNTLERSLAAFCSPETLDGDNKYKCGNCKRKVQATKALSILQPPNILTIQLKRFNLFGNKINKQIAYPEKLNLAPFLAKTADESNAQKQATKVTTNTIEKDPLNQNKQNKLANFMNLEREKGLSPQSINKKVGQDNHNNHSSANNHNNGSVNGNHSDIHKNECKNDNSHIYSLYAVLLHHGSSTRSGHYTALVKSSTGTWLDADDQSVSSTSTRVALNNRDAYVLFYVRNDTILPFDFQNEVSEYKELVKKMKNAPPKQTPTSQQALKSDKTEPNGSSSEIKSQAIKVTKDDEKIEKKKNKKQESQSSESSMESSSDLESSSNSDSESASNSDSESASNSDSDSSRENPASSDSSDSDSESSSSSGPKLPVSVPTKVISDRQMQKPKIKYRNVAERRRAIMDHLFGTQTVVLPTKVGVKPVKNNNDPQLLKSNVLYGGHSVTQWSVDQELKQVVKSSVVASSNNDDQKAEETTISPDSEVTPVPESGTLSIVKVHNRAISELQKIAKQSKKRKRDTYDVEYDRGKLKKVKKKDSRGESNHHYDPNRPNPFQAYADGGSKKPKGRVHIKGGADKVKRIMKGKKGKKNWKKK